MLGGRANEVPYVQVRPDHSSASRRKFVPWYGSPTSPARQRSVRRSPGTVAGRESGGEAAVHRTWGESRGTMRPGGREGGRPRSRTGPGGAGRVGGRRTEARTGRKRRKERAVRRLLPRCSTGLSVPRRAMVLECIPPPSKKKNMMYKY